MNELLERVRGIADLADLDVGARRLALRKIVGEMVDGDAAAKTLAALADAIDGFGPLGDLMRDPDITDILVNGHEDVWVERAGVLTATPVRFRDALELHGFIERIVGESGAHVDVSSPIADARLADGSRVHVVLPPVAARGPFVSIRRWPPMPLTLDDLVALGLLSADAASRLQAAVVERSGIAISGGTGTGKTTLLNALIGCIGADERIVTIEETAELRPPCRHALSLTTRASNIEGQGEISLADLVRASLRMRPDRIIVGEVRGPEMLAALAALSTGHEGSMLTVHARSASDAVERMVSLALSANGRMSESSLRRRIQSAFDLIVHLERTDGRRMVAEIEEVRA